MLGFHVASPSRFNTMNARNLQSSVSKTRYAIFLLRVFAMYSVFNSEVETLHMVPYLSYGTNFFWKNTTAKIFTTTERRWRHY